MLEAFQQELQRCLQNEPAFCSAACPFQFEVVPFIEKIKKGSFQAAFRLYQNAVAFPGIVARICDQPCQKECPRAEKGGSIALRALEEASLLYARDTKPHQYNLPPKDKSIAIIGGGFSSLSCALRLASRNYRVTLYERSANLGGRVRELLPEEFVTAEIEQAFRSLDLQINLGREVQALNDPALSAADALYIATGTDGATFGLSQGSLNRYATKRQGVFWGGALCDATPIQGIADGLAAADAIEWYLKTGRMDAKSPPIDADTKIKLDTERIAPLVAITPQSGASFSREEAVNEAGRCLQCACDACVHSCDLMNVTGKYPKRIWEEVRITIHPGSLDKDATVAKRLIATCNQCGLCKETCPQRIDVGAFLRQSHLAMQQKQAMPWAFHQFWLRDMASANSEAALLGVPRPEQPCKILFFPGCQLGAADPFYVSATYRHLLQSEPSAAILQMCCGAPAEWAGQEALREETLQTIRNAWQSLDQPLLLLACPSCRQIFERYLPELKTQMLYSYLVEQEGFKNLPQTNEAVSLFDPCAARHLPEVHQAVRQLVAQTGRETVPLAMQEDLAHCCSFGGQVSIASPVYARTVIQRRISENDLPYVAYCINCRDAFLSEGKASYHLLDLLFRPGFMPQQLPTVSQRRDNRLQAKDDVLRLLGEEPMPQPKLPFALRIPEELKRKLDQEKILESDLAEIIRQSEASGRKLLEANSGVTIAHSMIGAMTFWVEYIKEGEDYALLNAYGHRMRILEDE